MVVECFICDKQQIRGKGSQLLHVRVGNLKGRDAFWQALYVGAVDVIACDFISHAKGSHDFRQGRSQHDNGIYLFWDSDFGSAGVCHGKLAICRCSPAAGFFGAAAIFRSIAVRFCSPVARIFGVAAVFFSVFAGFLCLAVALRFLARAAAGT